MRRTRRNKKQIIIGIISSIVLVLTIGYSFLSLNLRVLGLAHIGAVWNIHFDNITINPDSVSLSSGDIEPEIDDDNDCKINYKVTLTPGDFYEFTFDIVNEGTIDGMIQNMITRIEEDATASLPSYIDYSVTYSDDVIIENNQQLLKGTTETIKVRLEFLDGENVPQSEIVDLSYEMIYIKKTSAGTKVKHPQPLYDVFEDEYNSNSGLVHKYSGNHKDSFTEQPSKDIYHWYAPDSYSQTESNAILDKWNVIFANHCWQMWRTTDTGGVKLVYNGEVENNQCLNTRGSHVGYSTRVTLTLNSNYWYGTDYEYDSINKKFSISGTTEQATWNDSTYSGLIGKYTCKSTTEDGTCSILYLVESYNSSSYAYAIPLNSNSHYSKFGILEFNSNAKSPSYVGYMYGDIYTNSFLNVKNSQSFVSNRIRFLYTSFAETDLYSKTIRNTGSGYELVNPILGSDIPEDSYVGYYTFKSNTIINGAEPYYIVGSTGIYSTYYVQLSSTNDLSSFYLMIADSITDKLDGTYELSGTMSSVSPTDWFTNYASYVGKYTCGDASTTICANPILYTSTTRNDYYFLYASEKIMIGKTRSGLNITDTMLVRKDELVKNSSNYSDYKYTCNSSSASCAEATLRMIVSYTSTGYNYVPNHYYGTGVTWDGTNYTLANPIDIENYNNSTNLSTHHYMCVDNGLKTCAVVIFIYHYDGSRYYFTTLRNGVLTIDKALENMFTKNTNNSIIKNGIDAWYKHYLYNDYNQYIEDTIFCNNRSIQAKNGWDDNDNLSNPRLQFNENTIKNDLSCTNITDQFSISNNYAQLTYKIGLMSVSEANIMYSYKLRNTGQSYWLISPRDFYCLEGYGAYGSYADPSGVLTYFRPVTYGEGLRPSISLIPGIMYTDGDGSKEHPYVIKTD